MSDASDNSARDIQNILAQFNIHDVQNVKPVSEGLIHNTLCVSRSDGQKFILQRLHEVIPDLAIEDMQIVTQGLHQAGLYVPDLMRTNDGQLFFKDESGKRWRLYPWMEGRTFNSLGHFSEPDKSKIAYAAGHLVGKLHAELAKLDYTPVGSIPHFHDTGYVLQRLSAVRKNIPDALKNIEREISDTLPELISNAPTQLIHGDQKISNLLFDDDNRPFGIIDFDTLLKHDRLVDIGDAIRSWCNPTSEDDQQAQLDVGLFDAVIKGYSAGSGYNDTRLSLLRATRRLALELSARFLTDVVEDCYFGFDQSKYPTRREANIARTLGQFSLSQSILESERHQA